MPRSFLPLLAALVFPALPLVSGCDRHPPPSAQDGATARTGVATIERVHPEIARPKNSLTVEERKVAPSIDGATSWLNVEHPLDLSTLKGHVTVVDFWTSCCINCLQTLPVLAKIESTFAADHVVVLGVHSPKFDAETERERLRSAVEQYRITHPVAVDGSMTVWNRWGVDSWPTLFVLDSEGRILWRGSGEPTFATLAGAVVRALDEGAANHTLATTDVAGLAPERPADTPLLFPTKAIALADGGMAVADSGHDRVVIVGKDGKVADVVGSGLTGAVDGTYGDASFHKPQGLAEVGDRLFVADTENHEIRVIDRKTRTVGTVAGTGMIGNGSLGAAAVPGRSVALRSPWDLATDQGRVYVALAGSHQIAVFDPVAGTIASFAGDGHERRKDGAGEDASFAQPSGLAVSPDHHLYVADSETSSVRDVDLTSRAVRTVVGKDLFVFGDVDGDAQTTRFEHPIGIAFAGGKLYVADTYNSKLKVVDPATGKTKTLAGGRDHQTYSEPNGVFAQGSRLYVVDTNHARIVPAPSGVDDKTVPAVPPPLAFAGLKPPPHGIAVAAVNADPKLPAAPKIDLPEIHVAATGASVVHLTWDAPKGTGVNEDAPLKVRWRSSEGLARVPDDVKTVGGAVKSGLDVAIEPLNAPAATLIGDLDMVVCDIATHRVCVPLRREITLGLELDAGGPHSATAKIPLPAALVN
jgi:thiol-disulfide isomerase/thioredoxin